MLRAKHRLTVRMLLAGGVLAVWSATGCGDDPPTASVEPVGGSGAITVVAEGASYDIERIEVQAGATTTVALENRDDATHTLTIYLGETPEGEIAADTGEVGGGERGEAVVFFAAAGEHAYRCEIHPDAMSGTLIVR